MKTEGVVIDALSWSYDTALRGGLGFASAVELGNRFREQPGALRDRADSLIRWQVANSAVCGLIAGACPGPTALVTQPATSAFATMLRLRMIASIAHMADYDVRAQDVRTFAYACLCGRGLHDLLQDVGIVLGKKLTKAACERLSKAALKRISREVATRLASEWAEQGLVVVAKAAPFVGAATCAYLETRNTRSVGQAARDWFI